MLDTETTGIDPKEGHRIIELAQFKSRIEKSQILNFINMSNLIAQLETQ